MTTATAEPRPSVAQCEPIEFRFERLKAVWERETRFLSDPDAMAMHRAYQEIIGMGPGVIPLILNDLARAPNFWFWALSSITGEDPIDPETAGNMVAMSNAWLAWGRDHGYVVAR